jgi:hypothetical protein
MSEDIRDPQLTCAALQSLLRSGPLPALSREQLAHLGACDACTDVMIQCALAAQAAPVVGDDFASRVCASLPAEPLPLTTQGRRLSGVLVSLMLLLAVICFASVAFALSPKGWVPSGMAGLIVAGILLAEIVSLALWLDAHYSAG